MFCAYVSALTPTGSGRLEWHSRHEFFGWAVEPDPTQTAQNSSAITQALVRLPELLQLSMPPHLVTQPYTVIAAMYPRKTQATPVIHGRVLIGFWRSRRGRNRTAAAINPNADIPSISPSMPRTFAGITFSVSNMNRKYHSGLMPAGAEAKGSALCPGSTETQ